MDSGKESLVHQLAAKALRSWPEVGLLALLQDKERAVRALAAREVHSRGTDRAFEVSLELAAGPRADQRETAAFVLGQFGTPNFPKKHESLSTLLALCCDRVPRVRSAAVAALGHLFFDGLPDEAAAVVVQCAKDPCADVRASSAVALSFLSDSVVAEKLLRRLRADANSDVQDAAVVGLEILSERELLGHPSGYK